MRASACVGRVGGLAVALGIGVAVTIGAPATWASPAESSSNAGDSTSGSASAGKPASRSSGRTRSRVGAASSASISGATSSAPSASRSALQGLPASASTETTNDPAPVTKIAAPVPSPIHQLAVGSFAATAVTITDSLVTESIAAQPAIAATATGVPSPAAAMAAQPISPTAGIDSVSNPLFGTNPQAPVQSALSWVALAATRRERRGTPTAHTMPTTALSTSDPIDTGSVSGPVVPAGSVAPSAAAAALATSTGTAQTVAPVAAAIAADPISAFIGQIQSFVTQIVQSITQVVTQVVQAVSQAVTAVINVFVPAPVPTPSNAAPIVSAPTVGNPNTATGVVTGQINATDPNGDTLTYNAPAGTTKGLVNIDSSTGAFTYTPTTTARNTAASAGATAADKADTFTVTITDGHGGSATVSVNVAVSPTPQTPASNRAPVAGTPTVSTPNVSTGVVTGTINAADPDGDPLSYSGSATTSKGSVTVTNAGSFTYTPTANARHAAAQIGATNAATTDSFTISVTDGKGGTTTIPVTVTVGADNSAPVAGIPTVSTPNPTTGTVSGTVIATDGNGDNLTYTAPTSTSKGSVTINGSTGSFTYTPTVIARNTAANAGATAADKADTFTITITDSHGGSTSVPVTVAIAPANRTPIVGAPIVGTPNASTGVVNGTVIATDPDGNALSYNVTANPAKGTVMVDAATGAFTFTPTLTARHAAAAVGAVAADKIDTFTVAISDGNGGLTSVSVTLDVGATARPQAGDIRMQSDGTWRAMYAPNVASGATWIAVNPANGGTWLTDADVNSWLDVTPPTGTEAAGIGPYSAGDIKIPPGTTAGGVTLFAVKTAAPLSNNYSWMVCSTSNGCGGVSGSGTYGSPIPVEQWVDLKRAVVNSPSDPLAGNRAPVAGVTTVGVPNVTTGVVTGTVTATDQDGDTVTYAGSATTSKGSFTVTSNGAFTYTPTLTARHAAAALNSGAAAQSDSFAITASDGRGGTTSIPLTVAIRPANSSPTATVTTSAPNLSTGAVSGTIIGIDADTDALTYTAGSTRYGGRVAFDSSSGQFTYTPAGRLDTVMGNVAGTFTNAWDVAFSPSGDRAYIADIGPGQMATGAGRVSVVDPSTNAVIATYQGLTRPTALAITPNGARLYVIESDFNQNQTVAVIDTANGQVLTRISGWQGSALNSNLEDITISPDGSFAYVLDSYASKIDVLDTSSNTVVSTITGIDSSGPGSPYKVIFSSDGSRAYVATSGGVSVVNTANNAVIRKISGSTYASGMAVSPDGTKLYVPDIFRLTVIDTQSGNLISSTNAGTNSGLVVSPDGQTVYGIAYRDLDVTMYEPATLTNIGSLMYACNSCAGSARSLAISPTGARGYIASGGYVSILAKNPYEFSDSFEVTITDGHGGTVVIPVDITTTAV